MAERLVKPVNDNMDKYDTYRVQKGRYNQAMESGFYFEAMIIVYGIMEDRIIKKGNAIRKAANLSLN